MTTIFCRALTWISRVIAAAICLAVAHGSAQAQFVYVNNETFPNTVSAFRVNPDGSLAPVPGSPFATNDGKRANRLDGYSNATIAVKGNFLFALNPTSDSVSVFTIQSNGALTLVPGSPFPTGGQHPVALAVAPNGELLFIVHFLNNVLSVFRVSSGGQLTRAAGSPVSLRPMTFSSGLAIDSTGTRLFIGGFKKLGVYSVSAEGQVERLGDLIDTELSVQAIAITPNNRFVYAVGQDAEGIGAFRFSNDQLSPLAGAPFLDAGMGRLLGLAVNPAGDLLTTTSVGQAGVYLFRINANGSLRDAEGSPYSIAVTRPQPICFNTRGTLAFTTDPTIRKIRVLQVDRRTFVEIASSPFDLGHASARPTGIAVTGTRDP
ncbi:MAG: beta-propeller fold lactonase family protein [Acidobacteriota bacterium]|nr:beta-propeller fold lactonase family protein [Blastocatellia bacterium]MDW8240863.1 beta-propeller fold lactonase family protein [Acidobacteriota bacterium]